MAAVWMVTWYLVRNTTDAGGDVWSNSCGTNSVMMTTSDCNHGLRPEELHNYSCVLNLSLNLCLLKHQCFTLHDKLFKSERSCNSSFSYCVGTSWLKRNVQKPPLWLGGNPWVEIWILVTNSLRHRPWHLFSCSHSLPLKIYILGLSHTLMFFHAII